MENISSRTMRRRLFQNKDKRYVVSKKITIRRQNRSRRISFCRQKFCLTVENNWSKVTFSDKTKVGLWEDKKKICVEKSNEPLHVNVQKCLWTERNKVRYRLCFLNFYRPVYNCLNNKGENYSLIYIHCKDILHMRWFLKTILIMFVYIFREFRIPLEFLIDCWVVQ